MIENPITLKIDKQTADQLQKMKNQGDTYDSVIKLLIVSYLKQKDDSNIHKKKEGIQYARKENRCRIQ